MEHDEYAIMRRVEDGHWWYRGLRAMLWRTWKTQKLIGRPRLLDVGCGTGANLSFFREVADCHGMDFSREAVRLSRERGGSKTIAASALHIPFADNSFDIVISCDVVCHRSIPQKIDAIREMARVLKPGGVMIVNLPAYQWLYASHDTHVQTDHRFTRGEVNELLSAAGLKARKVRYWNSLLFPIIAPIRIARKRRPLPASDLQGNSGEQMSPFFAGVLAVERLAMIAVPMPFGLSIMATAKKP